MQVIETDSCRYAGNRVRKLVNKVPEKPGVYVLWGKEDNCLYVGRSQDLSNRLKQHYRLWKKFNGEERDVQLIDRHLGEVYKISIHVVKHKVEKESHKFYNLVRTTIQGDLWALEETLIETMDPMYNVRHKSGQS